MEDKSLFVVKKCLLILLLLTSYHVVNAQKIAVKTNLVADATLSPNLGLEIVASNHWSFCFNGTVRPCDYPFDNIEFPIITPPVQYEFQRPLCRFYMGLDLVYVDNDIKIKNTGYKGDAKGAGVLVGYNWILSNHWNLEVGLGVGAVYANQYKYEGERGDFELNYKKWLPVPTSCAVSIVYIIK